MTYGEFLALHAIPREFCGLSAWEQWQRYLFNDGSSR